MNIEEIGDYLLFRICEEKDLHIKIKKPRLDLLNPKVEEYSREHATAILGVDLADSSLVMYGYPNIIKMGLRYKIFDKWLKVVGPAYKTKYIHKSDFDGKKASSVFPQLNRRDFLSEYVNYILNYIIPKTRDKRFLIERYYLARKIIVANGRDPKLIPFDVELNEKQRREWEIMNLDYNSITRSQAILEWKIGSWRKLNGKLIKRCSKTMFRWESGSYIRFRKLPLIGYEENNNTNRTYVSDEL